MSHELTNYNVEELTQADLLIEKEAALADAVDWDSRELWRVVSADGTTRIFQTRPAAEGRPDGRPAARRAVPCPLDVASNAQGESSALLDRRASSLPTVVADPTPASAQTGDDTELSAELTSVTQAWPTLSPGIRGAVMALIRAASTGRSPRPAATPRRV